MNRLEKILPFIFIVFSLPVFSQEKIDLLILNKNYPQALIEIEKVYRKNPSADLMFKQGLVYKLQQDFQKATEAFVAALELAPENTEILNELAETFSQVENYTDAAFYYRKALEVNPENLVFEGKLGATLINLKDYKNALQVFSSLYEKDSTNFFWNKQYAFCLAKTGKDDSQAIGLYENMIPGHPRNLNLYINLYALYSRAKNDSLALVVLTRGLAEFPENPELTLKLANCLYGIKNYAKALEVYTRYLSTAEPEFEAMKNYGICLYFTGSETEAIEVLEKCLEVTVNDPIILSYLSLSHKKLANYELAEEFMRAAIEAATPSYLPKLYHHLGQIYWQERKFKESIEALKESYKQDSTNFEILFEIASTYEELTFNRAIALDYYQAYLSEGGDSVQNKDYVLNRIEKIQGKMVLKDTTKVKN